MRFKSKNTANDLQWSKSGEKLSERVIIKFENQLGLTLPGEYREFLMNQNGGIPSRPVIAFNADDGTIIKELFGIGSDAIYDLRKMLTLRFVELPAACLPIGLDVGGNHILLRLSGIMRGEVLWKNHEVINPDSGIVSVARSMTEFIEKLMPEEKPDLDRIELLAKNGGEPDVEEYLNEGNAIEARSKGGRALAQEAAGYGNLDILRLCVALGGDTRGALHLASMNGHLAAVKYLVEHVQVDINATNEQGYRPLACAFLHPDVQAYLLSRGGVR